MKKVTLIILCLGMFLVGLLTSQVLQIEKANAGKMIQYKVVTAEVTERTMHNDEHFEKFLNTYANQGWKLHSKDGLTYIFER